MNKVTDITVGNIIEDIQNNKRYRIISIIEDNVELCEMNTPRLNIIVLSLQSILDLYACGDVILVPEDRMVFDTDKLSEKQREAYQKRRDMMRDVVNMCFPSFIFLYHKSSKQTIIEITKKYNCSQSTFWRICTKYFQSGMNNAVLVNAKFVDPAGRKHYKYTKKTGRKSKNIASGVLIDEQTKKYFNEALNAYKSQRQRTLKNAFDAMNALHYRTSEVIDDKISVTLLPSDQRPTWGQFYYYANKHLTKQERDQIKTSQQEQRNNKRLLISDAQNEVYGPGDMVEIDACETDISLVSCINPNQTIGRPVVYFMIDVFSRIILAASIAFDNNSVLGITNLFLNLVDNKKEFCTKYGLTYEDDAIWPSNIIPRRVRLDRASELKGKEFNRICGELGIEKQLLPGASGSLKGIVEQSFHQMHVSQSVHLENYGLIEKRYDSQHHKEATLNIEQYTRMVINFVLTHNQKYNATYPLTREMIEHGIKPIPALIWQFGVEKYGNPRPISAKEQYLYTLMVPIKASLSRRGIFHKGLWYLPNEDVELTREMFNIGNKRIPFTARMDMRDISAIYYLRNNKLISAPLNKMLTGNADYSGMTMKQWEDYRKAKSKMNAEGKIHNEELSSFRYVVNESVVESAKKDAFSHSENIRIARENEKQRKAIDNRISIRLDDTLQPTDTTQKDADTNLKETEHRNSLKEYSSWEEAIEDFCENN